MRASKIRQKRYVSKSFCLNAVCKSLPIPDCTRLFTLALFRLPTCEHQLPFIETSQRIQKMGRSQTKVSFKAFVDNRRI